ncbi:MAG: cobalamin biosynthesis protein CobQ, partial [Candidatus Methanomethylophilaceae archaeon]
PSMNLAMSLGIPFQTIPTITEHKHDINQDLEENSISEVGEHIICEHSMKNPDGIRVVVMGAIHEGGSGCLCSAIALVKVLLNYLESEDSFENYDVALIDSQAGPEILGRGLAKEFNWNLVLTEPTPKSAEVSRQVVKLANDLGVKRHLLIVNKSESEEDIRKVSTMVGIPVEDTVRIRYDRSVIQADWDNRILLDAYPDSDAVSDIKVIRDIILESE